MFPDSHWSSLDPDPDLEVRGKIVTRIRMYLYISIFQKFLFTSDITVPPPFLGHGPKDGSVERNLGISGSTNVS